MGILENRLSKIEAAQSKGKVGFWMTPWPAFYGMRNCPQVWQERVGELKDFFTEGCGYCEGCNESFCKMDDVDG